MMKAGALEEKKMFNDGNVEEDLQAGNVTVLKNVAVLKVSSVKDKNGQHHAFPSDYPWFEDGPGMKEKDGYSPDTPFSVIAPITTRPSFEGMKRDPTNKRPHQVSYNIDIEQIEVDLHLTNTEARWFAVDLIDGHADIFKSIGTLRYVTDPVSKQRMVRRNGVMDVIAPASGAAGRPTSDSIGEFIIESGMYAGKMMKEIPEDYILKGSLKGGLGSVNDYIQGMCDLEKRRRYGLDEKTEKNHCHGLNADDTECKMTAGLNVAEDGEKYCRHHFPGGEE